MSEPRQVQRYLLASIGFWMNQFGMDGFRFIDVASMIYLDRGRWVPSPEQLEEYLETSDNIEKARKAYDWTSARLELVLAC